MFFLLDLINIGKALELKKANINIFQNNLKALKKYTYITKS